MLGALSAVGVALLVTATAGAGPFVVPNIYTVAGTGASGNTGDGGQGTFAEIDQPRTVVALAGGGFVWTEPFSNRIRKVGPDGVVSTVAGTGLDGYSGDGGPATGAMLKGAHGVDQLVDGSLVFADTGNSAIRKIAANGVITTIVGDGTPGFDGDGGPAVDAEIDNPREVAAMPDGGFIFPDTNNNRVRRVWPNGTITTVAGTGTQGFGGDDGPAALAELNRPFSVSPTADGGFLVADIGNQRIRKVAADGTITTVAGTGIAGYAGDNGPATDAEIQDPHDVKALPDGSFLIADTSNLRVRRVAADGTITTIAGNGTLGSGGDGSAATAASLFYPKGVDVDANGAILVAEEQGNRIRFVGTPAAPANASLPIVSGIAMQGRGLAATTGGWSGTAPAFTFQWLRCDGSGGTCDDIPGATGKTYLLTADDVGSTMRVRVTAANASGSSSASSDKTDVVSAAVTAPDNTALPTISGTPQSGQTLTATPGTWNGTAPIAHSYQWLRCDGAGANCAEIVGATSPTYTLTFADLGSRIRVRVSASNDGSSYDGRVLADTPVAYWQFNDSGGALADARAFSSGTYVNGPTRGFPGLRPEEADKAVLLDGASQYLEVPPSAAWTQPSFSIEILVRPSGPPDNRTIWSMIGPDSHGWWLNTGPDGAVRMFVGNGAWQFGPDGPVLTQGVTYHLVATFDGSNSRLYVNGALVSTGPPVTMSSSENVMRFGAHSSGPGQYWPGVIDDASFYGTALTPAQVAAHYDVFANGANATSNATPFVSGGPTAVTVTSFVAARRHGVVRLRWRTAREADLLGFDVYRATTHGRVRLNGGLIATGGRAVGRAHSWVDRRPGRGIPRYWLRAVSVRGTSWIGPVTARPRVAS